MTSPTQGEHAQTEALDALADSQYLAGVKAGWNAANSDDPNAAFQQLHDSRAGYLKPLHAQPAAPQGAAYAALEKKHRDFVETVSLMLDAIGYKEDYARQWPKEKASITFKRWFDEQIAAASAPVAAAVGVPSDAQIDACARSMLYQPWGIGSRIEYARAFGRRILSKFAAAPQPTAPAATADALDAALLRYALAIGPNQAMNWCDVYDDWNGEDDFADALRAAMAADAALAAQQPTEQGGV
jgi:hypothetical protein